MITILRDYCKWCFIIQCSTPLYFFILCFVAVSFLFHMRKVACNECAINSHLQIFSFIIWRWWCKEKNKIKCGSIFHSFSLAADTGVMQSCWQSQAFPHRCRVTSHTAGGGSGRLMTASRKQSSRSAVSGGQPVSSPKRVFLYPASC